MLCQTTSSTPKMGGESQHQAVKIFVGYALVPLLFAWGILARRLAYLQRINSKGVTQCGNR